MKIALVTTTIFVPQVLKLYRKLGSDIRIFVACDMKTPIEVNLFCGELRNALAIFPEFQTKWKCSALLGMNTIRRRNIAVLEALAWGADIIVSCDDDNIPLEPTYFYEMVTALNEPFNGCQVSTQNGWFDPGTLMVPKTPHRGFPHVKSSEAFAVAPVVDARVGVAAGLCLGDPDIDAVIRLALRPMVYSVSELARAGVVSDPSTTRVVFNTQNTAYLRELAPAMFCAPGLGRHDDIYASLITQRIMREKNLSVHLGQPFVHQQRNVHNLIADLKEEIFGTEHILELADQLDAVKLAAGDSVIGMVQDIYQCLALTDWWPSIATEAALAWCEDCEAVL